MTNAVRASSLHMLSGAMTGSNLLGIVRELRRLNRSIAGPLERDLKQSDCPSLEVYEVLRELDESCDVHLRPVDLQKRLAVPQHRLSRLIDRLVKAGYVDREKSRSDARGHFVTLTDSGRRVLNDSSSVISASLLRYFYRTRRV